MSAAAKREWKPGDVAMVHIARWPSAKEWPDDTSAVLVSVDGDGYLHAVDGDPAAPLCVPPTCLEYVRRLVVIDPEDREAVERLRDAIDNSGARLYGWQHIQAALREFANPTPPKPDEPTAYLAAVIDAEDVRWARVRPTAKCKWINEFGDYADWSTISAVRVLSEGIQ